MHSFMRNVNRSGGAQRAAAIKSAITKQLSECVKEMQMYSVGEGFSEEASQEAESTFCTIIEAMLMHGVKDSFLHKARRAIADVDPKPTPSFWSPLLVISHRQTIEQVTGLSQITTEMGQCRAWVRVVLNDCLLSSYLSTIQQNGKALKAFYKVEAYVRDSELLDVARGLIEGIEAFKEFQFPLNSSLLNTWPLQSLVLAGIWSPTLRTCPVAAGVDVAQAIQPTRSINSETTSLNSSISYSSYASGIGQLSFNEDEALKIILANHSTDERAKGTNDKRRKRTRQPPVARIENADQVEEAASDLLSDNFPSTSTTSLQSTDMQLPNQGNGERSNGEDDNNSVNSTESSYNALIQSYNMLGGACIRTPELFDTKPNVERIEEDENDVENDAANSDTKVVTDDTHMYAVCIGKIANECGLDAQNYECADCKMPLSVTPKTSVCNFTGKYFCDTCMASELLVLPARVLHNWDFNPYRISQGAFNYIEEIKDQPTIDLKTVNPYIYTVSTDMSALQDLRVQLNFLRDYLYTCRESIIQDLREAMDGKEYMYEHVHQYAITDVHNIRNGVLMGELQRGVNFGREHVGSCLLCKQRGFICEICNKPDVLYPFDIADVFRCNYCNGVYHNTCLNAIKPCPKCERRKKREKLLHSGVGLD